MFGSQFFFIQFSFSFVGNIWGQRFSPFGQSFCFDLII